MQTRYIYEVKPQLNGSYITVQKIPVACLVFEDDLFGISVCSKNDSFNKKRARDIAIGRLHTGCDLFEHIPNRRMLNIKGEKTTLLNEVRFYVEKMLKPCANDTVGELC